MVQGTGANPNKRVVRSDHRPGALADAKNVEPAVSVDPDGSHRTESLGIDGIGRSASQ
jgi:hypothetical protein